MIPSFKKSINFSILVTVFFIATGKTRAQQPEPERGLDGSVLGRLFEMQHESAREARNRQQANIPSLADPNLPNCEFAKVLDPLLDQFKKRIEGNGNLTTIQKAHARKEALKLLSETLSKQQFSLLFSVKDLRPNPEPYPPSNGKGHVIFLGVCLTNCKGFNQPKFPSKILDLGLSKEKAIEVGTDWKVKTEGFLSVTTDEIGDDVFAISRPFRLSDDSVLSIIIDKPSFTYVDPKDLPNPKVDGLAKADPVPNEIEKKIRDLLKGYNSRLAGNDATTTQKRDASKEALEWLDKALPSERITLRFAVENVTASSTSGFYRIFFGKCETDCGSLTPKPPVYFSEKMSESKAAKIGKGWQLEVSGKLTIERQSGYEGFVIMNPYQSPQILITNPKVKLINSLGK